MRPSSLTHQHIAAALATEVRRHDRDGATIIDAGCGAGKLIAFLSWALPTFTNRSTWDVYGFDVVDSTSQRGFPDTTIRFLEEASPSMKWAEHIRATTIGSPWPFEDESADFVVTNQVLEHVTDLAFFLGEMRRVLSPGGLSINVFPLRNVLFEGHLLVPLAAKISGHDQRAAWLKLLYGIGLGKPANRGRGSIGASEGADYVHFATHYRPLHEFVTVSKSVGLRVSYRYTEWYYRQKLRKILRRPLLREYSQSSAFRNWVSFLLFRHLASITLVFERPERGSRFEQI
jgi:SAM-dependent methyltransferase